MRAPHRFHNIEYSMSHRQRIARRLFIQLPVKLPLLAALPLTFVFFSSCDARADTNVSTRLSLSGSVFGQPFNSSLFFDDDFGLRDGSVFNDTRGGSRFGTLSRRGRTLGRAPFDISLVPERAQTLSFGVPTGTAFTTLLAGRAQIESAPNQTENTNFFGARVSHPVGENLVGSVSLLRANDATERTGRDLLATSLTWTLDINRRVSVEIARSRGGNALQLNGGWRNNRVLAFAGLRAANDDFLLLDNARIERRNGGFAYLDYTISPHLNVIGATQRFSDGARRRLRDDNLRFEYSKQGAFASLFAFDQRRSGFRFEDPLEEFFALEGRGVGARVARNFGRTRLSAGALTFRNTRDEPFNSSSDGTQFNIGARHYLRDGRTRLFANATTRRENGELSGGNRRSVFTQAGAERRFGGRRGPTLSAAVDRFSRRDDDNSSSYGLRLAAYSFINDSTSLSVSWRTPFSSSSSVNRDGSLYLGISHRFGDPQQRFAAEDQRLLSRVRGRVYEDRNLNNVFDNGEIGLPDVQVQIARGSRVVTTESDGKFALENLIPGAQTVSLVTKTLPIEYSTGQNEYSIETKTGRIFGLDIPVVRGGRVSGIVFRDLNRNGTRDPDETPIANAVVGVEGSAIIAFSDADGRFSLNDLPPRQTKIVVNLDSIARKDGEEIEQTRAVESAIPSGQSAPDVALGIAPKPRETETTTQSEVGAL